MAWRDAMTWPEAIVMLIIVCCCYAWDTTRRDGFFPTPTGGRQAWRLEAGDQQLFGHAGPIDHLMAQSVGDHLCSVPQVQLAQDVAQVILHGVLTHD
jgi:hypothetical protein